MDTDEGKDSNLVQEEQVDPNSFSIPFDILRIILEYCDIQSILLFSQLNTYFHDYIHIKPRYHLYDQQSLHNCCFHWSDLYEKRIATKYPTWKAIDSELIERRIKKKFPKNKFVIESFLGRESMWKEAFISRRKPLEPKDFKIICNVGDGTFGRVYLVQNMCKDYPEYYALKYISKKSNLARKSMMGSQHEIDALKILNGISDGVKSVQYKDLNSPKCPYIIQYLDSFQDSTYVYILLEYINGGELYYLLQNQVRFSIETSKFIICEMIIAIEYCHERRIMNRCIQPENILLDHEGHIKLVDFQLSKQLKKKEKRYTFCGIPEYLSPEMIKAMGHDLSVDIWSLGVLLYELVVGIPPFYHHDNSQTYDMISNNPLQLDKKITPDLGDLLKGILEKDPSKRMTLKQIKQHKFFEGVNWELFKRKDPSLKPPKELQSGVKHAQDISNISIIHASFFKNDIKQLEKEEKIVKEDEITATTIAGVRFVNETTKQNQSSIPTDKNNCLSKAKKLSKTKPIQRKLSKQKNCTIQ